MNSSQKKLRWALQYASQGWPVFPAYHITEDGRCSCEKANCSSQGKHPLTYNGLKDATLEAEKIRHFWHLYPKANICIVTGAMSGIFVVDIDKKHGGLDTFNKLEQDYGAFPDGPRVKTGGGGIHIYLKYPSITVRNRTGILTGIDIRGDGGYVIAPPSNHASGGHYEWIN